MNPFLAPGHLTSGRRTYKGNRLVGGMPDSHHLDGSAGDYTGTTAAALRQFFGNGAQIIPESDHLHVQGMPQGTFPYFGNQGVAGLVNGVDTSAPQGTAMRPRTLAQIAAPSMGQMPVGIDPSQMPQTAPMSLADLALPQGDIPQKKKNPFSAGNILGVLGDALMAYGGMQPQFGPNLAKQQENEADRSFDREKLNAQLELARQKALEPPQFAQNAAYFNNLDPSGQRSVLQYEDATNPINVSTPQGTQNVPRTTVKTIGGKTYYSIGGEWYEEGN